MKKYLIIGITVIVIAIAGHSLLKKEFTHDSFDFIKLGTPISELDKTLGKPSKIVGREETQKQILGHQKIYKSALSRWSEDIDGKSGYQKDVYEKAIDTAEQAYQNRSVREYNYEYTEDEETEFFKVYVDNEKVIYLTLLDTYKGGEQ